MAKQMDRGGAQPQQKTTSQILSQVLLAQRQADQTRKSAPGIPTKRAKSPRTN